MEEIARTDLDPNDLKIDTVNERVSNVNPYSEEGESLQNSIEELGVIDPIVVREIDGEYHVVAGQRRTLAAQAAGEDSIPARILKLDDTEARIISITENAEEFDKEVPPEDRATSIKELLEDGLSFSEIADRIGFSEPTVRKYAEPALDYWEDTVFEADPEADETESEFGLDSISLRALQVIRSNTSNKQRRERIAKKVVRQNVKNKFVNEASNRANTGEEFEQEIDRIIEELNSDITRIREKIHLSGSEAEQVEEIMKSRGVGEKEILEMLIEERLEQLENNGEWIEYTLDKETADAISDLIGDRDIPPWMVAKQMVKKKLQSNGYLD
jgi:ParB family chromosome partitioning protein